MKHTQSLVLAAALTLAAFAFTGPQALAKSHTVVCKDGTTSTAGRGACSGHGGVDKSAKPAKAEKKAKKEEKAAAKEAKAAKSEAKGAKAESKAAKAEATAGKAAATTESAGAAPAGATARCKDGTYSHAKQHRGACSKHGGVAEWLKQ